jgi:hypothetical protein
MWWNTVTTRCVRRAYGGSPGGGPACAGGHEARGDSCSIAKFAPAWRLRCHTLRSAVGKLFLGPTKRSSNLLKRISFESFTTKRYNFLSSALTTAMRRVGLLGEDQWRSGDTAR